MSRYILIRRLRGPAILLLIGTLALLHQMGAIPYFWRLFWPLLLITLGLLMLAERAALASEGYPIFPGAPWHDAAQATNSGAGQGAENSAAITGTAIVPAHPRDFENDREGGQP
ncbi:MAG TPA: DUF5668 domain-containing protein [Terracidiphilus sp.]|nr:DUF5668 domain-containing protein [Terracidiphilus sp.]